MKNIARLLLTTLLAFGFTFGAAAQSGRTYGASADLSTLKSTVVTGGEWTSYRMLENGKPKSMFEMAVVGKDGDAWVYEFQNHGANGEDTAFQEAVEGLDNVIQTGRADSGKVIWIKIKKGAQVQKIDGAMLKMTGAAFTSMLTMNSAHLSDAADAGGSVTVPAGTFASTYKVQSSVARGRAATPGTAWVSTLVPLWHLVKAVSDDGSDTLELVDFGSSGYKSVFQ